jgi:hypothetical protein
VSAKMKRINVESMLTFNEKKHTQRNNIDFDVISSHFHNFFRTKRIPKIPRRPNL